MVHSEGARVAPHRTAHRRAPLCVNLKYPHLESLGLESVALGSLNMDSLDGESRNLFRWNTIDTLIVESLNLELLQLKSFNLQYLDLNSLNLESLILNTLILESLQQKSRHLECLASKSLHLDSLHLFFRNVEVENNSEGPQPSPHPPRQGGHIVYV